MIYKALRELKEKSGLSFQEIAKRSNVPASTISRILSGQTDSPGWQTVADLVQAMGGSLDEMMGIKEPTQKEAEKPKGDEALIALYERELAAKDKTIRALLIMCGVLIGVIALIALYFCWDVTHHGAGIIQY